MATSRPRSRSVRRYATCDRFSASKLPVAAGLRGRPRFVVLPSSACVEPGTVCGWCSNEIRPNQYRESCSRCSRYLHRVHIRAPLVQNGGSCEGDPDDPDVRGADGSARIDEATVYQWEPPAPRRERSRSPRRAPEHRCCAYDSAPTMPPSACQNKAALDCRWAGCHHHLCNRHTSLRIVWEGVGGMCGECGISGAHVGVNKPCVFTIAGRREDTLRTVPAIATPDPAPPAAVRRKVSVLTISVAVAVMGLR
jgi:hypothetical protein